MAQHRAEPGCWQAWEKVQRGAAGKHRRGCSAGLLADAGEGAARGYWQAREKVQRWAAPGSRPARNSALQGSTLGPTTTHAVHACCHGGESRRRCSARPGCWHTSSEPTAPPRVTARHAHAPLHLNDGMAALTCGLR